VTAPDAATVAEAWRGSWRDIREEDIARVTSLLNRGVASVVTGGVLAELEQRFAAFCGVEHAVAVNNGTAALLCGLSAVGVGRDDEVLVPDYAFFGMATAILALGARVVPCDIEAETLAIDAADAARKRTNRTRAVLAHNPWGLPCDLARLRREVGLPIVSDASHAHGASYAGAPVATAAEVTCFSLGFMKLISGGELGCAVTTDVELHDRMMVIGHVNRVPAALKQSSWRGNAIGLKLRPHAVACALALGQLDRIDDKLQRMERTCARITAAFVAAGFAAQRVQPGTRRSYWKLVFVAPEGRDVPRIEAVLREHGIPVEPNSYRPLLQHHALFDWPAHREAIVRAPCPVAEAIVPRLITLPAPVDVPDHVLAQVEHAATAALRG
jgi:perosamine synthetase